jgi:hypothetical protein
MECWQKTSFGWIGGGAEGKRPELLVAILADSETPGSVIRDVVAAWMANLPHTLFVIVDRFVDRSSIGPSLTAALEAADLPASRLLLVGVRDGATLALSIALEVPRPGFAGLVGYDAIFERIARPTGPESRPKIRLIGRDGESRPTPNLFAHAIRDLTAFGLDVRGTLLLEPGWTPSAIRIGASYLAELSALALGVPLAPAESNARRDASAGSRS